MSTMFLAHLQRGVIAMLERLKQLNIWSLAPTEKGTPNTSEVGGGCGLTKEGVGFFRVAQRASSRLELKGQHRLKMRKTFGQVVPLKTPSAVKKDDHRHCGIVPLGVGKACLLG